MRAPLAFAFACSLALVLAACQSHPVLDSLEDARFELVDQDSSRFVFPQDVRGDVTLVGYVYTNCPDVCPMTTANMIRAWRDLGAPDDVRFVTASFDPERDTPDLLRRYRAVYGLDSTSWTFVTGDSAEVAAFMQRMGVRVAISEEEIPGATSEAYFIDHTDQVTLLDREGRVVRHYGGSRTPPEILVEDINQLR